MLLARRDFTVLVLGQGAHAPRYRIEEHSLARRAFTFLAGDSPVWRRVLADVAQTQTFRRHTQPVDPPLQAIGTDLRFQLSADPRIFDREVRRELGDLHRVVNELYDDIHRVNELADVAFGEDAMWPPGTFWERRATTKLASRLPYIHAEPDADILANFPRGHFYRGFIKATALFGTHMSTTPPPFAIARLHGAWARDLTVLPGGETELEEFLVERIQSHGGLCLLNQRASRIVVKRGAVTGIQIHGEDHTTGADYVVTDLDGESLATLAEGHGIHKGALREWPRITSTVGRFVVSLVVETRGLPEALGTEVLLFPSRELQAGLGARAPIVHLQRLTTGREDQTLLVAEVLLRDHGALAVADARRYVVDAISEHLPFLMPHCLLVDSVHDGEPPWKYVNGEPRTLEVQREFHPSPMERQLEVDPPGFAGLAGEPIRGPIDRSFLVGRSVLPALGQEGELLAAWGAARLITKNDGRRTLLRRDGWTRLEFG